MIDPADPIGLVRDVASLLDSLDIPYCIGGSWASGFYGEPRMTRDLDVIATIESGDIERLACALEPRFYVSREAMREAVTTHRAFNAIDPDSGLKVDFFVRGTSPFDLEEFSRRRTEAIDDAGTTVCIKSPEDSVLRKLQWFRDGGGVSEQQWRDVLGVLDDAYLDRRAAELGLGDLLACARNEAAR